MNHPELTSLHNSVSNHSMYNKISSINDLKIMMESHVFAVWDFMSLLKRLQRELTCIDIPWKPSPYPKKLVRLINEIVLAEESDIDLNGEAIDHFSLYINAMEEIGAETSGIKKFILHQDFSRLSIAQGKFVQFNLNLAQTGSIHEVAAAFFFGREKLIPDMFTSLLSDLEKNLEKVDQLIYPNLKFYLQRHIEIDGGEHSHQALDCLSALCGQDITKWEEAKMAGINSLKLRSELWDEVSTTLHNK